MEKKARKKQASTAQRAPKTFGLGQAHSIEREQPKSVLDGLKQLNKLFAQVARAAEFVPNPQLRSSIERLAGMGQDKVFSMLEMKK